MALFAMTRGERRGIIVLLVVLAVIVAIIVGMRRCGSEAGTVNDKFDNAVKRDSLMSLPDTATVAKKKYKRRTLRKIVPKVPETVPERSPLDEVINRSARL